MSSEDTRFKPGQSGNPNGRPRLPDDIKNARRLNKVELERTLNKFLFMTPPEMKTLIESDDVTALEAMIGSIVLRAVRDGDQLRLNFIIERLLGKVKDVVQVEVPKPTIIERIDGGTVELGAELVEGSSDEGESRE